MSPFIDKIQYNETHESVVGYDVKTNPNPKLGHDTYLITHGTFEQFKEVDTNEFELEMFNAWRQTV